VPHRVRFQGAQWRYASTHSQPSGGGGHREVEDSDGLAVPAALAPGGDLTAGTQLNRGDGDRDAEDGGLERQGEPVADNHGEGIKLFVVDTTRGEDGGDLLGGSRNQGLVEQTAGSGRLRRLLVATVSVQQAVTGGSSA
jgi:hypothetical protein